MQRTSPAETAYLTFLNTLSHAAIVADGDLVVLANSSAEALLGYPPGGLEGMALAEIAPDGRPASIVTAPVPGWAGADDPPWEVRLRHRDGHTVLTDIGWRRVVLDGRPLLQIVERDSGTRLRAAALVRTSEERLRAAILVTNLGIFEHDHVRDEVYWSPEQRAIHGWDPDQPVTHADFIAAVHPEDRARVIDSVARAHDPAGDGRWEVEHRIVRPDGEVRWLHARSQTSFAPRDRRMRPARTVGAVADITAERAAINLQQMFQLSIDQASDAIYWLGPDGSLVYVNDEACRSLGYSHEELSHLRLWDIDPTYSAEAWSARWADFEQLSRPAVQRIESRHRRKDGTTFPVDVVAQHLPVRDSALHVAYVRDISERQRLEAQLLQAQKMESIGRLAGGIAHDFNNLLTVIQGNVALALLDAPSDGPIHDALQEVIKASDSASTLTRQLLAFARNEVIRRQVLDLNEAVTHLGAILRRLLGEDVHLQLDLDPTIAHVRFDPGQLEQILVNIAVNARDAMPEGGKLTITTRRRHVSPERARAHPGLVGGEHVMLVLSDNGSGMTDEVKANLFEPFFTTKAVDKGTGLGLAMVYGAVRMNGGAIEVDSEAGAGSTFTIYLPAASGVSNLVSGGPADSLAAGAETIVLVEDEARVRTLAVQVLRRQGYRVIAFPNGDVALEAIAEMTEPIDLLFTDVVLPGMNGQVLSEQVRALRPGIKVLYTSGYTRNVILHHGVLDEGLDFLSKPYSITQLARRVRDLLDAPR